MNAIKLPNKFGNPENILKNLQSSETCYFYVTCFQNRDLMATPQKSRDIEFIRLLGISLCSRPREENTNSGLRNRAREIGRFPMPRGESRSQPRLHSQQLVRLVLYRCSGWGSPKEVVVKDRRRYGDQCRVRSRWF